jgi:uncharacterized protein YecT (DUF1311 family)
MKTTLLTTIAALVMVTAAIAQDTYSSENEFNTAIEACSGNNQVSCLRKALFEADQKLGLIYRGRFSYLPKSEFAGLREAERAWIAFRDKNCSWLDHKGSDTYYLCMLQYTIDRKFWLIRNIGD